MSGSTVKDRAAARLDGEPAADVFERAAQVRPWRRLLWRTQRMAFWVLYDFAGSLILLNLLCLAAVAGPAWLIATVFPGMSWTPPGIAAVTGLALLAGQTNLVIALLSHEEFSLGHVWRGIRRFGMPVLGLGLVYGAGMCAASLGIWFYAARVAPAWPVAGMVLAGVSGGSGALLLLTAIYALPALVHQQGSLSKALRISVLLPARHPVFTLGLFVVMAVWGAVLFSPPGVLLFSVLPLVTLSCCGYELLARGYALQEARARGAEVPAETLDENDVFLNRGISDLLFPWKV